jgi:hypothetical protein
MYALLGLSATSQRPAWFISHQSVILFSQNKPATSQQYFSRRTNQPNEHASILMTKHISQSYLNFRGESNKFNYDMIR